MEPLEWLIEVDGEQIKMAEFLSANHLGRDKDDCLSNEQLKDLYSMNIGSRIFIHLSEIKRIM